MRNWRLGSCLPLVSATAAALSTSVCHAQCEESSLPYSGILNGRVFAISAIDTNSAVVAGRFTRIGTLPVQCIAQWDGANWSTLHTGMSGGMLPQPTVNALLKLSNGDLIAGGAFTVAGGVAAKYVARWDGSNWHSLDTARFNGIQVQALAQLHNGNLIVAGDFSSIGTVNARGIAQWDGVSWSALGEGFDGSSSTHTNLIVMPNGDLVAGGGFTRPHVRKWDGATWSPLGDGVNNHVYALALHPNGDLIVGGAFTLAGGQPASRIAVWNGSVWSTLGSGMNGGVASIHVLANGDILAGGGFSIAAGIPVDNLARWDGVSWSPVGSWSSTISAIDSLSTGELLLGGSFLPEGDQPASYFACWTETDIPRVAANPQPVHTFVNSTIAFSATPASGYADVSFQWKRNGLNINNGPGGASIGGGAALGSSGAFSSPTNGESTTLTLTHFQTSDIGNFTCTLTNSCGEATTQIATLSVRCLGDFNQDDSIDLFDYLDFVQALSSNNPAADINHDNVIDFFDYLSFVESFSTGC